MSESEVSDFGNVGDVGLRRAFFAVPQNSLGAFSKSLSTDYGNGLNELRPHTIRSIRSKNPLTALPLSHDL